MTGATGCLGRRVAELLRDAGHTVTGQGRDPERGAQLAGAGVAFARVDLRDAAALTAAVAGHEAIVHAAARSSPWGRARDFHADNVTGSANLIAAARAASVRRVVHVSTAGVYFDGRSRVGVRERDPLPRRPANHYVRSKLAAERLFAAALPDLESVTLRPRAIFGPGDTAIVPRLLRAHAAGRLRVIGDGDTRMDLTYVDNVADAAVLALEASPVCVGRAYNVTNGEPVALWPLVARLLAELGHTFRPRPVPYALAWLGAGAMELVARTVRPRWEPTLTRYTVGLLARSMTLDISAARAELGYAPRVSMDDGVARYLAWRANPGGRA